MVPTDGSFGGAFSCPILGSRRAGAVARQEHEKPMPKVDGRVPFFWRVIGNNDQIAIYGYNLAVLNTYVCLMNIPHRLV